ncbi:hypothetical protein ACJX0J_038695, partial [Zea mays]
HNNLFYRILFQNIHLLRLLVAYNHVDDTLLKINYLANKKILTDTIELSTSTNYYVHYARRLQASMASINKRTNKNLFAQKMYAFTPAITGTLGHEEGGGLIAGDGKGWQYFMWQFVFLLKHEIKFLQVIEGLGYFQMLNGDQCCWA